MVLFGYQTLICFNDTFKISCYMWVVYSHGLRKGTTVCALYEFTVLLLCIIHCAV